MMICKRKEVGRKGFTLVELLVVISIIALLLSILMPSLGKARESARRVVCANKMKQLGLGVQMYAMDYGHIPWLYPEFDGNSRNPWINAPENMWFNIIADYLGVKNNKMESTKTGSLGDGDYDLFPDFRRCPTGKAWIGAHYAQDDRDGKPCAPFRYKIAYNKPLSKIKFENIRQPSSWLLLMDASNFFVYSPTKWLFNRDADGDGMSDSFIDTTGLVPYNYAMPKVHNDGSNTALCDGHVEYVKYKKLWEYKNRKIVHDFWWD